MRFATRLLRHALVLLLLLTAAASARTRVKPVLPDPSPTTRAPRTTAIAGEEFANAIEISSLPFSTSGTT